MGIFNVFKLKYEGHKSFQEAKDFIDNINFVNVKNEDIILEQARKNFNNAKNSVEYIEKKTDDLLKYLGVGTGFLGILLNYSITCLNNFPDILLVAGFTFWIISIFLALSIRKPSVLPYPASFDQALRFMVEFGEESRALKAWMASAHELAMRGQIIIGDKKANKLNIAFFLLAGALCLFFVSFLLRIILP